MTIGATALSFTQAAVAAVLLIAALTKALDAKASVRIPLVGAKAPAGAKTAVIILETLLGVALLAGLWALPTAIVTAAIAVCFVAVQATDLTRGEGCRCFGALDSAGQPVFAIVRATALAAAALMLAGGRLTAHTPPLDAFEAPRPMATALGAAVGFAGVIALALLQQFKEFRESVPRRIALPVGSGYDRLDSGIRRSEA